MIYNDKYFLKEVEFTQKELNELKKLIDNFLLYYENENDVWNFIDLENQRQLACRIVKY